MIHCEDLRVEPTLGDYCPNKALQPTPSRATDSLHPRFPSSRSLTFCSVDRSGWQSLSLGLVKNSYTPFPAAFVEFGVWGIMIISIILGSFASRIQRMDIGQIFNLFEGILWISISFVFLRRRRHLKSNQDLALACMVSFALFGLSDFIEIYTRAWFQPIYLLLLKAACVTTFFVVFIVYTKRKRAEKNPIQS